MIELVFVLSIAALWLCFVMSNSASTRRADAKRAESEKQRVEEVAAEQIEFVRRVDILLPDAEAAMRHLRSRYSWEQILETICVSSLEIALLTTVSKNADVSLPNLKHATPGPLEKRCIAASLRAAELLNMRGAAIEAGIQEPTTSTLALLAAGSYVQTEPEVNDLERTYVVRITETGRNLISWHGVFRDIEITASKYRVNGEIARQAIARVFRCAGILSPLDRNAQG
jgi:hypothetical protein